MQENLVKKTILGVGVTSAFENHILEYISSQIEKKQHKVTIFTPNPEMVVHAAKDSTFKNSLNSADIALCDGMGLWLAALIVGKPIKQRITGVDFMKNLTQQCEKKGFTVGFLGGRAGVAVEASERLKKQFPGLNVIFTEAKDPSEETVTWLKQQKHVDVLFVAYGFPNQEEFIAQNIEQLPVTVAMGVGGALDYISGKVVRAPYFVRFFGFEWLFRLVRQPWRIKRQLALLTFLFLVLRERFSR